MSALDQTTDVMAGQADPQEQAAPVPVEKDVAPPQAGDPKLGPNFEYLEKFYPQYVTALRQMVLAYRQEGIYGRRLEIRRIRQARLFWQELQYGWFDPFSMNWRMPFQTTGLQPQSNDQNQDFGRYQFVTNYYQAFGLSFISVISQDVPSVVFYPQDVDNENDIAAAKADTDAVELIEMNNRVSELLTGLGYYLWTDGKIGSYTRYVADGERFGFIDMPDVNEGQGQLGEDAYECPGCGTSIPASGMALGGMCPNCGSPVGDDDLRPATSVAVPISGGTNKLPKGQEVITIVGGLELNTPITMNEIWEFPWLQWQMEVHQAKLKAAFPHVRDKLSAGNVGAQGPDDTYARITRIAIAQGLPTLHPGDSLNKYATLSRTWLRPWAFEDLENKEIREGLKALFPDGCYCAFVGETYCESRNENMLDKWRVMHALPGDGQSRPSVGNSMISVQERINTISNISMEQFEFGIPPIYYDPSTQDSDAIPNQVSEPGSHIPARARPGQSLASSFFQPEASSVDKNMIEYSQELSGPVAQMLTGLFPAVYGGSMDDVKTASAYAQARDQALGRLGLVWRRLKQFYADTMMLAVKCMAENRPDDPQMVYQNDNGKYDAKRISLSDLKGNTEARPEADETFPRLKSQQKAVVQQLMTVQDPMIQKFLSTPKNLQLMKGIFGLNEFDIPEEDARNEQLREIDELLQQQPVDPSMGMPPQVDPMGQPMPPPPPIPSVQVDPIMDNHQAHFATCQEWWASDRGQDARTNNPGGAANVRAHALQHFMLMQQQMAPPPEAGGGDGEGPSPAPGEPPNPEPKEVQG